MSPSKSTAAADAARPSSKADRAYDQMLECILDGTYAPGSRLVLDRVARDLGISTLPVREAIRRLEAEGHVHFQRNVGATVASVDAESYVQAVETMAVLEGAATGQAVAHTDASQLARLRELNREMEEALDRLDGRAYADAHDALHEVLIEGCPNTHLIEVVSKERARLRRLRSSLLGLGATGGRRDLSDHEELFALIESGATPERVEDAARTHLQRTAETLRGTI